MRVNFIRGSALPLAVSTLMQREHIERPANRLRILWVECVFQAAFEAAERMTRIRVFFADYICGQLFVLDELHTRSLSRTPQAVSV